MRTASHSADVVIAGAGNIGFRLARALEDRLQVKLIERNPETARRAAPICSSGTPSWWRFAT